MENQLTFFSMWRPLCGWVLVLALGLHFLVIPAIRTVTAMYGHKIDIPCLDTGPLVSLVAAALGLGGLRTLEKLSEVEDNH